MNDKPVIVIGGGGHARVLIDALWRMRRRILLVVDPALTETAHLLGAKVSCQESAILSNTPDSVQLVNGVGFLPDSTARHRIFEEYTGLGYSFASVRDPSSFVSDHATVLGGSQILAGALIQPGSHIGRNSIINTKASVDHDCHIGDHVHIAPGSTLCGGVTIGNHSFVGSGTTIIHGTSVGERAVISAGSLVHKPVPENTKYLMSKMIPLRSGVLHD